MPQPNSWARKIGQALKQVRPGLGALATSRLRLPESALTLTSPDFADGGPLPARYTQDGEKLFPPLAWAGLPAGTRSLALLVEDADAPFPRPLVHAILHAIPPEQSGLAAGAVPEKTRRGRAENFQIGRNSLARLGWLAPSPIPGHGPHRYAFQLFAASIASPLSNPPTRGQLLRALRPHVLGWARLIAVYQR